MKLIKYIFFIPLLFSINSCHQYPEIHELSFIISLGIDYDYNTSLYNINIYIINNTNLTQNENQSTKSKSYIGKASGKNITEALATINKNEDISLEYKHIKTIFLTKNVLTSEHLDYLYTFFSNGPFLYPSFEIFITDSSLEDLYNVDVFEETTLFYTIFTGTKKTHYHEPITFYEFVNDMKVPNFFKIYPVCSSKKDVFTDQKNSLTKTTIDKVLIFDELKNHYILNYSDFYGLYFLSNFQNKLITLKDIEILIDNNEFNYTINKNILTIYLDLEINYIYSPVLSIYEYKPYLEITIKEELTKILKYSIMNNLDILNINYYQYLKRKPIINLSDLFIEYKINLITP